MSRSSTIWVSNRKGFGIQKFIHTAFAVVFIGVSFSAVAAPAAFVGRLTATLTQSGQTQTFIYTAGTNTLRIERGETDWPHARNLVDRQTGALTLLYPHNRSLVRLKNSGATTSAPVQSMPGMPPGGLPPGIGPQAGATPGMPAMPVPPAGLPPAIGPTNLPGMPAPPQMPAMSAMPNLPAVGGMPAPPGGLPPGIGPQARAPTASGVPAMPAMPAMPMMPMPGMETLELKATGDQTNLLGCACARYEIKQRGEVMEIWATDQLLPYQPWRQNQSPRFGPPMIEEQWGELVKAKKLFPLLAVLKFENGAERLRFEVKSVTPQKAEEQDGALFQPPADYHEVQPLPF
jgi:hypothetical protein